MIRPITTAETASQWPASTAMSMGFRVVHHRGGRGEAQPEQQPDKDAAAEPVAMRDDRRQHPGRDQEAYRGEDERRRRAALHDVLLREADAASHGFEKKSAYQTAPTTKPAAAATMTAM